MKYLKEMLFMKKISLETIVKFCSIWLLKNVFIVG